MDKQDEEKGMLSPYVSVDCVLLSIKNDKLTVLLTEIEMGKRRISRSDVVCLVVSSMSLKI